MISKNLCQHQNNNFFILYKNNCNKYYNNVKNVLGKVNIFRHYNQFGYANINHSLKINLEFKTQNTFAIFEKRLCEISHAGSERLITDLNNRTFTCFIPAFLKPQREKKQQVPRFSSGGFLAEILDGFDITDKMTQKQLTRVFNQEDGIDLCITINHQAEANKKPFRDLSTSIYDLSCTGLKRMFMLNLHATSKANAKKLLNNLFQHVKKERVFIHVPSYKKKDKFMIKKSLEARELAYEVGLNVAVDPKIILENDFYSVVGSKIVFKHKEKTILEKIYRRWIISFEIPLSVLYKGFLNHKRKKNKTILLTIVKSLLGSEKRNGGIKYMNARGDPTV